ncbi:MAG: hypothetical protein FJ023_01465 [Chloroflexi bacterium]|nr:hypothetical protein [Chloroflexota bacterium]
MNKASMVLQFFARLSCLYDGRFLRPLWSKYPDRDDNDWDALSIFLEGYAFARQGAPSNFAHAGCAALRKIRESGFTLANPDVASELWAKFSTSLHNTDLNYANNPLCPKETEYRRKYRGTSRTSRTSRSSALEFLVALSRRGESTNIIAYAKQNLEREHLRTVHQLLSNEINGIGNKIASFFLRDVATFYHILPSKDRHLLQPIDTWVRRVSEQLMGRQMPDEEIAMWIVQEAEKSVVSSEAVNQGMWYFGSQIGGSEYRVSCALDDLKLAKVLVDEHIDALQSELEAWRRSSFG